METFADWLMRAESMLLIIIVTGNWRASIHVLKPSRMISSRWFALPPRHRLYSDLRRMPHSCKWIFLGSFGRNNHFNHSVPLISNQRRVIESQTGSYLAIGSVKAKVLPCPSPGDSAQTRPPWTSMSARAIVKPMPLPPPL